MWNFGPQRNHPQITQITQILLLKGGRLSIRSKSKSVYLRKSADDSSCLRKNPHDS